MNDPITAFTRSNPIFCAGSKFIDDFEVLYDKYAPALLGIIHTIITDELLAIEVLQITFTQIWEKKETYDADKMQLFTWMYHITRATACEFKKSFPDATSPNEDPAIIKKAAAFRAFAKNYSR